MVDANGLAAAVVQHSSQQQKQPGKKDKCPNCSSPGDQMIYVPLADLPEAQGSELVFNSRSPKAIEVTPTFYKRDGAIIPGIPVRVQAAEIRYVDMKMLLPPQHRHERDWGGLSLSYYGENREMWSQLRFLGVNGGSSVDEFFAVKDESRSEALEAAWWMPRKSTAIIALGNITDTPTSAIVTFGDGDSETVSLAPHGTEIIRHKHSNDAGTESVGIQLTGMPGSIIPTGVIASKNGSFNSTLRFYDIKRAKQANLFANGLRLANITPHMVLRNSGSDSVIAQPKFISLEGIGGGAPVVLPEINLAPSETIEVDLSTLLLAAKSRNDLDVVSVQVSSSGAPGSLIGSVYGINDRTGVNYEVPLRDSGPIRSMTGAYPWKITKDYTTIVYITNISDREAGFVSQVNFDGGKFVIDPRKLAPGETAVFDLQKIRNAQTKDNEGRSMPNGVTLGQFKWAVHGLTDGKVTLIGRTEMVSPSQQVSTSYSCSESCPPYYWGTIEPFPGSLEVNASGNATAKKFAYYGSGSNMGPYPSEANWSVVDDSVATVNPSEATITTSVTGQTPGSGTLTANLGFEATYTYDGQDCLYNGTYAVEATAIVEVVAGVGKIQYQSDSNYVDISGTLYVLKGTSVTFKGVPNPSNASFASGKPVWTGSSGASGTGETTSVTFNNASSSASDNKTVIATSGNSVTVNVIVYELNGVLTPANDFAGRSHIRFGIEEEIQLTFGSTPSLTASQLGGLRWKITTTGTGNGTLPPADDGTGTYNAADTAKSVTLKLEVLTGPSKGNGITKDISIVEPTDAYITRDSGVQHTHNTWSVGFKGRIYVTPSDVSFLNLSFYEGAAQAHSSGWLAGFISDHSQSALAIRINSTNAVNELDIIHTGTKNPPYGSGEWYWDIPWHILTNSGRDFVIKTPRELATSDNTGKAVISKAGESASKESTDSTSNY
jgi:hypothetical protein